MVFSQVNIFPMSELPPALFDIVGHIVTDKVQGEDGFMIVRGSCIEQDVRIHWYPFAIRVLTAIADCIRNNFACYTPDQREAIESFSILITNNGHLSLDKTAERIIGYGVPLSFISKPEFEDRGTLEQRTLVYFMRKCDDCDGAPSVMELDLHFDKKTFNIVSRSRHLNASKPIVEEFIDDE